MAEKLTFTFCESVSATGTSPWHIRALEKEQGLKLTGGIDTDSLCGRVKAPMGWDAGVDFSKHISSQRSRRTICDTCFDRYEDYLRVGDLYFEHEGKKYIRMRDVDGLEKQLLDGTARTEWHVLHHPSPQRAFYLMELSLVRRLNRESRRWFKPEVFRLYVPENKVSEAFLQALSRPRSSASSSTGTSSVRPERKSARRTTSGSQS